VRCRAAMDACSAYVTASSPFHRLSQPGVGRKPAGAAAICKTACCPGACLDALPAAGLGGA
jgi:hypothetical protein